MTVDSSNGGRGKCIFQCFEQDLNCFDPEQMEFKWEQISFKMGSATQIFSFLLTFTFTDSYEILHAKCQILQRRGAKQWGYLYAVFCKKQMRQFGLTPKIH